MYNLLALKSITQAMSLQLPLINFPIGLIQSKASNHKHNQHNIMNITNLNPHTTKSQLQENNTITNQLGKITHYERSITHTDLLNSHLEHTHNHLYIH